jgi:hypothetical protein
MTITRVGTNSKYATGWDSAFSKGKAKKAATTAKKKAPAKKSKKGKK